MVGTDYSKDDNFHGIKIRFLGLWDTVAAYGMPVEEMTRGISQWLFPLLLPSCELDKRVVRACHALSIDDERTTFHPTLWDESDEAPLKPRADGKRYLVDERVSQVWFAGVHSNVGGGYPDDSLAQIPLIWIMSEADNAGLRFKSHPVASPQTLEHPATAEDKDGRIYDPRSGLGGYYRYGPRDILALGKGLLSRKGGAVVPRIHESVLARIKNNAHLYAPKGLPAEYEVVTRSGEVLPAARNPYEKPEQAVFRVRIQEKVWNTIWWRRIVYFLTVAATIYLAIFPLMRALPRSNEFESPIRWVSDAVRMVGAFVPGTAADVWINGYARDPRQFLIVVFVVGLLTWWGSRLDGRIQNNMGIYWFLSLNALQSATKKPDDWIYRLRTSGWYRALHTGLKKYLAPAIFAAAFAYLGFAFASHAAFTVQDDIGWVCRTSEEIKKPAQLDKGEITSNDISAAARKFLDFNTSEYCHDTGLMLDENKTYKVTVEITKPFGDRWLDDASKGVYFSDPMFLQKIRLLALLPLRRDLIRPWFRIILKFGTTGGEETFLDSYQEPPKPKPESVTNEDANMAGAKKAPRLTYVEYVKPPRDGRLFIFVNDAVLPIPGFYGVFYGHNKGAATITVQQQKPCFACVEKDEVELKPVSH